MSMCQKDLDLLLGKDLLVSEYSNSGMLMGTLVSPVKFFFSFFLFLIFRSPLHDHNMVQCDAFFIFSHNQNIKNQKSKQLHSVRFCLECWPEYQK